LIVATYANLIFNSLTTSWQSNVNFAPSTNNTLNIGTVGLVWANLYANNVNGTNLYGTIQTASQPNITANSANYLGTNGPTYYASNATMYSTFAQNTSVYSTFAQNNYVTSTFAPLSSPSFSSNVVTIGTAAYNVTNGNFGVGTSSPISKIAVQPAANNTDAFTVGSSDYSHYFTIKPETSANAVTIGYWNGSNFANLNISAAYVGLPTNVLINGQQAATQSYVTSALSSYAPIAAPSFTGIVQDTTNYAASPSGYDATENLVFNNSTNITGLSFSGSDNRFFAMGIGPANSVFMRTGSSATLELNVGKVGIGTGSTLPSYKLDVVGDIRASANVYSVSMNANGAVINGTNGYFSAAGGVGQLQAVGGSGTSWFNAFLRNDGATVYLMQSAIQTSQGAATNASWNSYRPFQWSLGSGAVIIDNSGSGTTFGGVLTAPSITLNSTNPGISFPNGVELYEDSSGNGPGDLVIETNNGTGHYTVFYSNGSFNAPSTIYQGGSAVATQSYVTGYAPSLTGSGASGTWGINVTGSAASITGTYGGSITSSQITTGLGYTPYNSTNPSGYITSSSLSSYAPLSGATFTGGLIFPNNIGAINIKSSTGSSYNAFQVDSANNLWLGSTNYNGGIEFYNNGACNAIIDTGGNLTVKSNITAYSDMRLKDNILTITNALDIVDELRGVTYNRIDTDSKGMGVIAQEVEAVIPEVVMTGEDGYKSVAYGNMVGLLIEAVKELRSEIEILKSKVL